MVPPTVTVRAGASRVRGDDGCVAAGAHDGSPCMWCRRSTNLSTLNNECTQKICQVDFARPMPQLHTQQERLRELELTEPFEDAHGKAQGYFPARPPTTQQTLGMWGMFAMARVAARPSRRNATLALLQYAKPSPRYALQGAVLRPRIAPGHARHRRHQKSSFRQAEWMRSKAVAGGSVRFVARNPRASRGAGSEEAGRIVRLSLPVNPPVYTYAGSNPAPATQRKWPLTSGNAGRRLFWIPRGGMQRGQFRPAVRRKCAGC